MGADRMYCIASWANVRMEPDGKSEILYKLRFGEPVEVGAKENIVNGKRRVILRRKVANVALNAKETYCAGWVPEIALTFETIIDIGRLLYVNESDHRIPVRGIGTGVINYILPDEQVAVIARVGNMAKTSKGWTEWGQLKRRKGIYDDDAAVTLSLMIASRAALDYRICAKKLVRGKFKSPAHFCNTYGEMLRIRRYFLGDWYKTNFDPVTGAERLEGLDEELGLTEKVKERLRKDYYISKGEKWVRKKVKV